MTYDSFTIKPQELIVRAQQIAGGLDQQSVDTVHNFFNSVGSELYAEKSELKADIGQLDSKIEN